MAGSRATHRLRFIAFKLTLGYHQPLTSSSVNASMTGLEIARDFFFSWGRPLLTAQFPNVADKVAAGRILGGVWRAAIAIDEQGSTQSVERI